MQGAAQVESWTHGPWDKQTDRQTDHGCYILPWQQPDFVMIRGHMKRKGLVWSRHKNCLLLKTPAAIVYFFYPLDPNIMKKSGRILIVAELAREYGFKDVGGTLVCLVSSIWSCHDFYFGEMRTFQNPSCLVNSPDILNVLPSMEVCSLPYCVSLPITKKKQTWSGYCILQTAINFEAWCFNENFYGGLIVSKIEDLF